MQEIPKIIYGTAWKEDRTESLVCAALKTGFKAIDTANQRKHYYEEGVGRGIDNFIREAKMKRENLFLQTKFTFLGGQDHRLPYDPKSSITKQVEDSFLSSCAHLHTDYLDSYVLHGPSGFPGLEADDREAWQSMEKLAQESRVRFLGLSNVNLEQLKIFYQEAKIKPRFVQNRCYANRGWDYHVREFCRTHQIIYQGFSLLTANSPFLRLPPVTAAAQKYHRTIPQIIFKFAIQNEMIVLTGTTDESHMHEDLNIFDFNLSQEELDAIERIATYARS